MDAPYIFRQLKRYRAATSHAQQDDCLYRIGSNADVLTPQDLQDWNLEEYRPHLRQRVLNWLETSFCSTAQES